jgi:hypothetical protein
MTEFNAVLADDAANVFLAEFAEDVTYNPVTPTPANPVRSIRAVVTRQPPQPHPAMGDYVQPKMLIQVANDATLGISSATLDTGGDTITVAYRIGGSTGDYRIAIPQGRESHDAGMLLLELR